MNKDRCRGVTPIRPGWLLARGPEGLGTLKEPLERASVYVRDQDLFWPGTASLGVTPLVIDWPFVCFFLKVVSLAFNLKNEPIAEGVRKAHFCSLFLFICFLRGASLAIL